MAWHHLINIQRLANLLTKPLLMPIQSNVTASELKALWETGVDAVLADADSGKTGGLKELRQLINELPPRSSRKRGKAEVLLPYSGGMRETEVPDEEEEEEGE
jgi:hypothetical protein